MTFHHVNLDISINDIVHLCGFKFTEIDKAVRIHSFVRPDIASEFDRIQYFEKNPSVLKETKGYNRIVNGNLIEKIKLNI